MLTGEGKQSAAPKASKKGSAFSLLGLCGAFLAVVGLAVSCTAGMVGNSTVAILGIVVLLVGAGLGAKYK
jgi:hypothetical protein